MKCMAHRGFSGKSPENTLAAFKMALEVESVDSIELDVQRTKDGELVVIHDFTLERTTNGKGNVRDKTLVELRELDAGSWFSKEFKDEKIPTLEEVLLLSKNRCFLNIELKTKNGIYNGYEKDVINLVKKHQMENQICLTSFDLDIIKNIKHIEPTIQRGFIVDKNPTKLIDELIESGSTILSLHYRYVTKKLMEKLKEKNIKLVTWTVNKKGNMKKIIELSSDIKICTNYPDIFEETKKSL